MAQPDEERSDNISALEYGCCLLINRRDGSQVDVYGDDTSVHFPHKLSLKEILLHPVVKLSHRWALRSAGFVLSILVETSSYVPDTLVP